MVKQFLAGVIGATLIAGGATAETRTRADFVVRLLGATIAEVNVDGSANASGYVVNGQLTTRGIVGALVDVLYVGKAEGRRSGAAFLPNRYAETVTEGKNKKSGGLDFKGRIPHPEGYKADERGADALSIDKQGDTVDPLTAMFMVLRDQPSEEVCRIKQYVFDGERRTFVDFTKSEPAEGGLTCTGTFRRIAGYPHDRKSGRRKVVPMTIRYQQAGDVMQVAEIHMVTDYGPATLRRR